MSTSYNESYNKSSGTQVVYIPQKHAISWYKYPLENDNFIDMWCKVFVFAVFLYLASVGYSWLYLGIISVAGLSESLAFTGGILIGASFALSGLTFFYNFYDTKLKYRKDLGLMGFYFATLYAITLAARYPERYIYKLSEHIFDVEVLLGLSAMCILGFMFIISFGSIAKRLGSLWRPLLRLGYLAYLLLIIRAFVVENASWQLWLETFNHLPPPRLILTIFAIWVIILRLILEVAIKLHKKPKPRPLPDSSTSVNAPKPIINKDDPEMTTIQQ